MIMGVYHQGGIIPSQTWLGEEQNLTANMSQVFWWRTYSPPIWLLGHKVLETIDLMGMPPYEMQNTITAALGSDCDPYRSIGLTAPSSSVELETWLFSAQHELRVQQIWRYRNHLNLDDLDVAEEGILKTLKRVVGRRGLVIWRIERKCEIS